MLDIVIVPLWSKIVDLVGIPQYVKFTCTGSHMFGPLDMIGTKCGLQPELLEGDINHSKITKMIYNELRHFLEPLLKSDILCLAFTFARHAMEMQKKTKKGIGESLKFRRNFNCC